MSAQHSETTSATLLARIQSGETEAWRRLTRVYGPLVQYWCKRWGVADADIDDLVQEVWVALGPTLHGFHGVPQRSFRAWIRGVTRHKVQDWRRRQAKQLTDAAGGTVMVQFLQQIESDQDDDLADDSQEAAQKQALYTRALAEIRDEFENRTWLMFLAVAVDGKSVAEVAAEFGLTAAGVRKVKSRVFHRLRQELGELID
jgi:RNA polymerase sigma-70 factor, ECF subfamily